jgi:hypothetical protein
VLEKADALGIIRTSELVIEDAGNKQITIKPNLENEQIVNLIKTPKEV